MGAIRAAHSRAEFRKQDVSVFILFVQSRCVANDLSAAGRLYCISHAPGICGMKYQRAVAGGSVFKVRSAQPPSVCLTVAVNVSVLGTVHVVNFHELPGMNPSGRVGGRSLTT